LGGWEAEPTQKQTKPKNLTSSESPCYNNLLEASNIYWLKVRKQMETKHSASMEDYLESILMLSEGKEAVRVSQMSKALGVKMPSVTSALTKLSQQGLVKHERYGRAQLTADGERVAEDVFHRHEALRRFLTEILDIDPEIAVDDACKMEHSVSPATQEKLAKFIDFVLSPPEGQPKWLKIFHHYLQQGEFPEEYVTRCLMEE
jgi:DtxR family Mn-dependent transcriptional regulator